MKKALLTAAALIGCTLFALIAPALAQTTPPAPPSSTIDFAPLIITHIMPAVGALLVGVVAYLVNRFLKIKLDERTQGTVNDVLQKGLAFATAGVARLPLKIDVHSPIIASAANYALTHGPDALKRLGITPQQLAEKLVARYVDPTVPVGLTELDVKPIDGPTASG